MRLRDKCQTNILNRSQFMCSEAKGCESPDLRFNNWLAPKIEQKNVGILPLLQSGRRRLVASTANPSIELCWMRACVDVSVQVAFRLISILNSDYSRWRGWHVGSPIPDNRNIPNSAPVSSRICSDWKRLPKQMVEFPIRYAVRMPQAQVNNSLLSAANSEASAG